MSYTCPACGATSQHPDDERYSYCGRCHQFADGAGRAVDSDWFLWDFSQALLRARARRRARMNQDELARDLAREAAEKGGTDDA